jgi:hypothetical protein
MVTITIQAKAGGRDNAEIVVSGYPRKPAQ